MDNNVHLDHVAHIALQAILGVLTTWPLRPIYRVTFQSSIPVRVIVSSLAIMVFSAIWTAARIYTFTLISGETGLWHEFHYWYFGSLFVFLSWTVLYYGISSIRIFSSTRSTRSMPTFDWGKAARPGI